MMLRLYFFPDNYRPDSNQDEPENPLQKDSILISIGICGYHYQANVYVQVVYVCGLYTAVRLNRLPNQFEVLKG